MKLRKKYTLSYPYGEGTLQHDFSVEGSKGAVNFWVHASVRPDSLLYGGLQIHYRTPPSYRKEDAPDHHGCPYTGGICWHDSTSAYAQDFLIPSWEACGRNPEDFLRRVEMEYTRIFREESENND